MLKNSGRLQGKEVRFLTKKRQVFAQELFTIFFVEQYPNHSFHQISFHIPLLVSKRAVVRHQIKRILIQKYEESLGKIDFGGKYYKCFVTLNKTKLQTLIELVQKKNKISLKSYLDSEYDKIFTSFARFLGKPQTQKKPLFHKKKKEKK